MPVRHLAPPSTLLDCDAFISRGSARSERESNQGKKRKKKKKSNRQGRRTGLKRNGGERRRVWQMSASGDLFSLKRCVDSAWGVGGGSLEDKIVIENIPKETVPVRNSTIPDSACLPFRRCAPHSAPASPK